MSSTPSPPSNSRTTDPPAPVLAKVPAAKNVVPGAENVVLAAGNEETLPAPSNIPVAKGAAGALNDATPLATSNAINVNPALAPEGAALDNVQPAAETVTQTLTGPGSQEVAEVPAAAGVKNGLPATSGAINVAPAPAREGAVPNKSQPAATTDPPAPELAKVPAAETAVLAVAVDKENGDDMHLWEMSRPAAAFQMVVRRGEAAMTGGGMVRARALSLLQVRKKSGIYFQSTVLTSIGSSCGELLGSVKMGQNVIKIQIWYVLAWCALFWCLSLMNVIILHPLIHFTNLFYQPGGVGYL